MQYYTEEECLEALQRATRNINLLTESCTEYTRNINDCFAFYAEYDLQLRGHSKARDLITKPWKSSRQWMVNLMRQGYNLETYAEYCGYEIIPSKRPQLGDIAFLSGSGLIAGDGYWYSTCEDNSGVTARRRITYYDRHLAPLARPRK